MHFLRKKLGSFLLYLEGRKKPIKLSNHYMKDSHTLVQIKSVSGHRVAIHLEKKAMKRSYKHASCRLIVMYELRAEVSENAPELLKKVCDTTLMLPPLLHRWASECSQREAVIQAFLDYIISSWSKERLIALRG